MEEVPMLAVSAAAGSLETYYNLGTSSFCDVNE